MATPLCKVALLTCNYNGQDIRPITHCIRIYESMCKPYRTAEVILTNSKREANFLDSKVGDQIDFTIQNSWGGTYSLTSYVTALPDMFKTNSIHDDQVTIGTVTQAFMRNKGTTVQWSGKNMPITAAIAAIHGIHIGTPLQVLSTSRGMIATDQIGSYVASGDHPFKVIQDLCARCGYGGYGTGSTVYFEDKYGAVIAPLEQLITAAPDNQLIDSDTWGTHWQHIFGGADAEKAILASKIYHKDGQASGGAGEQVKMSKVDQTVYDQKSKFPVINALQMGFGNLLQFAGRHGGLNLSMITDPARNNMSTDPATWAGPEANFKSQVRDGTNFLIRTTIESGFKDNFTAGKRVDVKLRAPMPGDPRNVQEGPLLIADLMHEAYFDNRDVQGTSTLRGVKIGRL